MTKRIDRSAFRKARETARDNGYTFVLPDASIAAGEDFEVRLRRISLQEKAATNGISQDVQDEVFRRTRDLSDWQAEQQKRRTKPTDQLEMLRQSQPLITSLNAVCVAAFIDPPLVETEAELASTPDAWVIEDFSVDDRWGAFQAITNGDSTEAKSLRLFRPESADDVSDHPVEQVAAPPERAPEFVEVGMDG